MYVFGSAGTNSTYAANLAEFGRWKIIPRMLRDATVRNLEVRVIAPVTSHWDQSNTICILDNFIWRKAHISADHCTSWRPRNRSPKRRICFSCCRRKPRRDLHHEHSVHSLHRSSRQSQRLRTSLVPTVLVRLFKFVQIESWASAYMRIRLIAFEAIRPPSVSLVHSRDLNLLIPQFSIS